MRVRFLIERAVLNALPAVVFVLLGLWTIALFIEVPYAGFDFNPANGLVIAVYDKRPGVTLQLGDQLLQVDTTTWEMFKSNLYQPFLVEMPPGQPIPLRIRRGEQEISLDWIYPGFTTREFLGRLNSPWWLAYIFWLIGSATWLFLRPKDERWRLLVAFNFVTAIALSGESQLSRWQVWGGAIKLASLTWVCMLVYLHLHTIFPQPLWNVPTWFWLIAYLIVGMLVVAELFRFLPPSLFLWGVLLGGGGTLLLLALHFWYQPNKRRDMILIIAAAMLALLPTISAGVIGLFAVVPALAGLLLLALPIWPLAYFYVAARRQLVGELELRANRLISLYAFLILLGTLVLILVPLLHTWWATRPLWVTLATVLFTSLLSVIGFARFERYFERRVLGIPWPPEHLLASYGSQITTSLDVQSLLSLLHRQILPSLLVRQAVLLEINDRERCRVLGAMGLDEHSLPTDEHLPKLREQIGSSRSPFASHANVVPHQAWVRVILPLQIGAETIGLWLLGRRDPDDCYAQSEVTTLQTIANYTAIALTNITQAKRLRTLHQTSIERDESERHRLSLELHDVVLNELAELHGSVEREVGSRFEQNYRLLRQHIRQIIKGLRPPLLSYGLEPALEQLIDDLSERQNGFGGPLFELDLDLDSQNIRYDQSVEQHLFRIVQQACENALRHANADTIWVTGQFAPTEVELMVADDGIGFQTDEVLDFTYLLTHQHYGIVSMWERAELIGAMMQIESAPNRGTSINITWQVPNLLVTNKRGKTRPNLPLL